MSMTVEGLYLRLHDEVKAREYLQTRFDALENFIKDQYPQYFAGECGTIADPELKPIAIVFGAPPKDGLLVQENASHDNTQ